MTFLRKYTVGCGDMDINYRLTKIAAVKYFQETFALYCAKNNIAAFDVCSQNIIWVISDVHIKFLGKMPFWSEDFEVEIWISEKSKLRTFADFRIYYRGNIVAQGDSCWYLLDMQTRRPVKSIDVVAPFELNDEQVFGGHEKYTYPDINNKISEKEHEVTVRDLDFNYHVNNLSYIGLALETVPPEYTEKYEIVEYKVKFVQETRLGEKMNCEVYENGNNFTAKIYKSDDKTDVCLISAIYKEKTDFCRNPREAGVTFV